MIYELTIYELGKLLNEINNEYKMNLLVKRKLSGGFITITGNVDIDYTPSEKILLKGNNIIGLKVKNSESSSVDLKITGIKDSKFKVEISPTKFKEVSIGTLSIDKIRESDSECKIKIDDDLIFTVYAPCNIIQNFIAE